MIQDLIVFRPISDKDESFLRRVYSSTRLEELAATGWGEKEIHEFLAMQFNAQHKFYMENYQNAQFYVVCLKGEDIGRLYRECFNDEIRIIDIALLPEYRNMGIGTRLVQNIIDEAAKSGLPVRIHVEKNNPALRLYHRLGFKEIKDVGVYWLLEQTQ
jgi:ribosomal protein S18 acetylase RimI-like enzyme